MTDLINIEAITTDTMNPTDVDAITADLNKAYKAMATGGTKYRTTCKQALQSSEGMRALCKHAIQIEDSYGDDLKGKNKAMSAIRNALKRLCDESDETDVTLTIKRIKVENTGQAYSSASIDDKQVMALLPNAPKAKVEKDELEKALQTAFNALKKDPCAMTKQAFDSAYAEYALERVLGAQVAA